MRVALVVPRTYHHRTNRRTIRIRDLVGGLVREGHRVGLITPRWWDQRAIQHHDRFCTNYAAGKATLNAFSVVRRVRAFSPEVIHLVDVTPRTVLATATATNAPIVYEATHFDPPIAGSGLGASLAWSRIARAVVPAEAVATDLLEAGLTCPIDHHPDPIEVATVERVVPQQRAEIVWTGATDPEANIDDLLLGLAELRDHDWRAMLFLDGPLPDETTAELDRLGLTDRIEPITGSTLRERVAVYRGANAFVQTAGNCAYPTEMLWAMAAGCLGVVQYQLRSSAHVLVEHHRTRGTLISTPEELADAIVTAADMEASTYEPEFERFDIANVTDALLGTYEQALSRTA